jgi:hypothetical protein
MRQLHEQFHVHPKVALKFLSDLSQQSSRHIAWRDTSSSTLAWYSFFQTWNLHDWERHSLVRLLVVVEGK